MTPQTETAQAAWTNLCDYIKEWFAEPDLEALRIVLCMGRAHFYKWLDPTWLMIVGPSGCGKTTLFIRALQAFPNAKIMGDLTGQTFLSGKRGGKSFLTTAGDHPFLLFKDFTTMLSKRPEDRMLIASQLRELHDGDWSKDTGELGHQEWKGKMTVIAACTPAIERYWSLMQELGERFTTVRVRVPPVAMIFRKMRLKRKASEITHRLQELTKAVVMASGPVDGIPPIPDSFHPAMDAMATMIAQCRQTVHRAGSKREVIDVDPMEAPTRIIVALNTVMRMSADVAGREVDDRDFPLALRLAIDSIAPLDWRILESIPPKGSISIHEVHEMTHLTIRVIQYHAERLRALRILTYDTGEDYLELSSEFSDLRNEAVLPPSLPT